MSAPMPTAPSPGAFPNAEYALSLNDQVTAAEPHEVSLPTPPEYQQLSAFRWACAQAGQPTVPRHDRGRVPMPGSSRCPAAIHHPQDTFAEIDTGPPAWTVSYTGRRPT